MIQLKITCDARRKKKDGTHPIVFRISLKSKTRDVATGISCQLKDWDEVKQSLKSNSLEHGIQNKRLLDHKIQLLEKLRNYELANPKIANIQEVRDYLANDNEEVLVYDFWFEEINNLKASRRFGTAQSNFFILNAIAKRVKLNIYFEQINYHWLANLEEGMLSEGLKVNGIAVYMRTLRSIYNKAIKKGVVHESNYPFKAYKIKKEKTTPRVISIPELKAFFHNNPEPNSYQFNSWNYGRLIFMLRGINFADLAILTRDNIKHGRIVYRRSKIHKIYSIAILPQTNKIIEYYYNEDRITLFPILTYEEYLNKALHTHRIAQQRKTCNKWLKKVGEELEINEKLSTYVFRYSWANAAKSLGFSKDLIAEALGHEYGNSVTGIYLNDFDEEKVDEMNSAICKHLSM